MFWIAKKGSLFRQLKQPTDFHLLRWCSLAGVTVALGCFYYVKHQARWFELATATTKGFETSCFYMFHFFCWSSLSDFIETREGKRQHWGWIPHELWLPCFFHVLRWLTVQDCHLHRPSHIPVKGKKWKDMGRRGKAARHGSKTARFAHTELNVDRLLDAADSCWPINLGCSKDS